MCACINSTEERRERQTVHVYIQAAKEKERWKNGEIYREIVSVFNGRERERVREGVCVLRERKEREKREKVCVCVFVREKGLTDEVFNAGLVITKDDKVSDHQLLHENLQL